MSNRTGRRGVAIGAPGQSGGDDSESTHQRPAAGALAVPCPRPRAIRPAGADALTLRLPAALAVLASLLLIVATPWLGMVQSVLVLPWFVPTVTALVCLALGVLAFLAYLRYATTHMFYPVAFALTCWAVMLFNFGFLLCVAGPRRQRGGDRRHALGVWLHVHVRAPGAAARPGHRTPRAGPHGGHRLALVRPHRADRDHRPLWPAHRRRRRLGRAPARPGRRQRRLHRNAGWPATWWARSPASSPPG